MRWWDEVLSVFLMKCWSDKIFAPLPSSFFWVYYLGTLYSYYGIEHYLQDSTIGIIYLSFHFYTI